MSARHCTVAVIAKAPEPGRTKTRLTPPCTPPEAARVAEASLEDTLSALSAVDARRHVLVLEGEVGAWLPPDWDVIGQREGGLGDRLGGAALDLGAPLVVIGMDTPQVTAALVAAACASLMAPGVDAVLGPATDGGYWLVGLRTARPEVFDGVPMSRPDTGAAQLDRMRSLGLSVTSVATLADVDTFADAEEVAAAVPDSRFARAVSEVRARLPGRAEELH